jgi:hypothetical protein
MEDEDRKESGRIKRGAYMMYKSQENAEELMPKTTKWRYKKLSSEAIDLEVKINSIT